LSGSLQEKNIERNSILGEQKKKKTTQTCVPHHSSMTKYVRYEKIKLTWPAKGTELGCVSEGAGEQHIG
jgi:hypothetical protein